jgi:hypothetical protein
LRLGQLRNFYVPNGDAFGWGIRLAVKSVTSTDFPRISRAAAEIATEQRIGRAAADKRVSNK